MNSRASNPRATRRRRLHQRQTVVFGILIAALIFAGGFAWLVRTGAIPSPWTREFTFPEKVETSTEMICPPDGAYTLGFDAVTVNVFNSSNQSGLASNIAASLREIGVTVAEVGNWPELIVTDGQIQTGNAGLVAAYTIKQLFPNMDVMLDDRQDTTVDILAGHTFGSGSMISSDGLEAGTAIVPPDACLPETTPPEDDGGGGFDEVPEDEPTDGEDGEEASDVEDA